MTTKRSETSSPLAWLAPAAVLLGTAWGSNQFTPMLLVYRHTLRLSTGTLEAMFGVYALGLIPGLLVAGPFSDARGRRIVVLPAAGLSLIASIALITGSESVELLFIGRLLGGLSSGAVFAAGTAWIRETSVPPIGTSDSSGAARRSAISMTAGFGLGPLVAGILAQWAPAPMIVPYLPHIVLMAGVLLLLRRGAPETIPDDVKLNIRFTIPGVKRPRFRRVVVPISLWVFAAPTISFALLPSIVGGNHVVDAIAAAAGITSLTAFSAVLIQPLARRLETQSARTRSGVVGLVLLSGGLVLGAIAAQAQQSWLLVPCAIVLGFAYGLCLVAGLVEVDRIAGKGEIASLTAAFYALTYIGFTAPFILSLAAHFASYPVLLLMTAVLALATAIYFRLFPAS